MQRRSLRRCSRQDRWGGHVHVDAREPSMVPPYGMVALAPGTHALVSLVIVLIAGPRKVLAKRLLQAVRVGVSDVAEE